MTAICVPVLIPAHVLDVLERPSVIGSRHFSVVDRKFVTDSDVDFDLRELSPLECAERGIRHTSEDDHYNVFSDTELLKVSADLAALERGE